MNRGQLVSIIFTTKNEQDVIKKALVSVINQTYPKLEIIVVDNYSLDKTYQIAQRYTKKVFKFGPERSAQRNFGAKKAKGDYLLFLDADMKLTNDVVKECVQMVQQNSKLGALTIPEISMAKTYWEKVKAFERSFYYEQKTSSITDAARFFKKGIFLRTGGYDETITGPEDWDLTETVRKLGYKIGKLSAYIYHYERIYSLFDLVKKKFYYALRSYRYLDKHKLSLIGPKTVYFLRPVFYKNFDKMIANPKLSLGMIVMLAFELLGGGLGYIAGRMKKV